jgi:hypothetical protein
MMGKTYMVPNMDKILIIESGGFPIGHIYMDKKYFQWQYNNYSKYYFTNSIIYKHIVKEIFIKLKRQLFREKRYKYYPQHIQQYTCHVNTKKNKRCNIF